MTNERAKDWLAQAKDDYKWGVSSFEQGYYSQTCFICQQVAEKALKAVAFSRGAESIRGHSVVQIAKALQVNDQVDKAARRLDQYYISARYPDALPDGAPFEVFTQEQAKEALGFAEVILSRSIKEYEQS